MEAMAVTPHEEMTARTRALEAAFYGLLDACDDYRETVTRLLEAEREADEPREQLEHRLAQLSGRVDQMTRILEDDALTVLVPMVDRLFTIERAEQGIDI